MALLWPSLPMALISRMSPARAAPSSFICERWIALEAKPIPGTEGAINPFFSPDGQWVGFFAGGKLKKVSVSGGAALTLGDAAYSYGASWGSQGMIAFAPSTVSVLQQVPDAGGAPQPLTRLEKGDVSHRWPEFLPGGKAVLFAASATTANWINAQVAVQSVGTGERRNLVQGDTAALRALRAPGLCARGSLMAVPFDPQRLTVTGTAVPVVEGVLQSPVTGAAQYSFSATGSLVYVSGGVQSAQSRLVWVSRNGAEQPLAAPAHAYLGPRLSPDGRRVAVGITEQESQVWLYDLSRETLTRLTFEGNVNGYPAWTPDGKRIAFPSNKEGPLNIFWQLADGSGGLERLTTSEYIKLRIPGPRMGNCWPFMKSIPRRSGTSGCCGWATARRSRSSEHRSTKGRHGFPPTGAGWPISRMNPATGKFTCSPIRAPAGSGKSRRKVARSRCGIPTGGSYSTAAATR